jgi:hypothetical protein
MLVRPPYLIYHSPVREPLKAITMASSITPLVNPDITAGPCVTAVYW